MMSDASPDSLAVAPVAAGSDYAATILACNEALHRNPQCADSFGLRARARRGLGDLDGAVADAAIAIRLNPRHAWAHRTLGDAYLAQGKLQEVIACCDEAIRLDPSLAHAYNTRAGARLLMKEFHAALDNCNQAIRLGPNLWGAYITRGNARYHLYDPVAAKDYRTSFQINPEGYTKQIVRLVAHQVQHERDYLFANCAEHLQKDPQDTISYTRRGVAHFLLGKDDEGQRELEEVLRFSPSAVERVQRLIAEVKRVRGGTPSKAS
jgi:tetratricopeptide (TPR) repeat protein